jgi:hypothetical protein
MEWQLVLLSVVLVCTMGAAQLKGGSWDWKGGVVREGDSWDGVTGRNSWLEYPVCVENPGRKKQRKRERELRTQCVFPATELQRRDNQRAYEQYQQEQQQQAGSSRGAGIARQLKYWVNDSGYAYVEFDVVGCWL